MTISGDTASGPELHVTPAKTHAQTRARGGRRGLRRGALGFPVSIPRLPAVLRLGDDCDCRLLGVSDRVSCPRSPRPCSTSANTDRPVWLGPLPTDRPWDTAQGHLGLVPKTTHSGESGWGRGKLTVTCTTCPGGKASRFTDGEEVPCEGASFAPTAKPGNKYTFYPRFRAGGTEAQRGGTSCPEVPLMMTLREH